jgi:hypothetical protein
MAMAIADHLIIHSCASVLRVGAVTAMATLADALATGGALVSRFPFCCDLIMHRVGAERQGLCGCLNRQLDRPLFGDELNGSGVDEADLVIICHV